MVLTLLVALAVVVVIIVSAVLWTWRQFREMAIRQKRFEEGCERVDKGMRRGSGFEPKGSVK